MLDEILLRNAFMIKKKKKDLRLQELCEILSHLNCVDHELFWAAAS